MKGTVLYESGTIKSARKSKSGAYKAAKMECEVEENGATNNMQSFQQQALEIREPDADFDPNTTPRDGEEFLMHMLYERKQCPAVMVRHPEKCKGDTVEVSVINESETMEKAASMCVASPDMLPTKEWKQVQVDDFEATRHKIALLREALAAQSYDQALEPPLITDAAEWQSFCRQHEPLLSTILRLSQRTLEQLLELINEWLQDDKIDVEMTEAADTTVGQATNSSSDAAACTAVENGQAAQVISVDLADKDQWIGTWLYAALTSLHMPLEPDVHSTLREIARVCMRLRERLTPQDVDKALPYNLFIYLIAKVFGQLDFAEYV